MFGFCWRAAGERCHRAATPLLSVTGGDPSYEQLVSEALRAAGREALPDAYLLRLVPDDSRGCRPHGAAPPPARSPEPGGAAGRPRCRRCPETSGELAVGGGSEEEEEAERRRRAARVAAAAAAAVAAAGRGGDATLRSRPEEAAPGRGRPLATMPSPGR